MRAQPSRASEGGYLVLYRAHRVPLLPARAVSCRAPSCPGVSGYPESHHRAGLETVYGGQDSNHRAGPGESQDTAQASDLRNQAQELGTQMRDRAQELGEQVQELAQEIRTQVRDWSKV